MAPESEEVSVGVDALDAEWERLQLLGYCLSVVRQGQTIAADQLERLRTLQAAVESLRSPGGAWETLLGLSLSFLELDVIASVMGPELEPRIGWMFQSLQSTTTPFPTRALLHELLALHPGQSELLRDVLAPGSALRELRLVRGGHTDAWQPIEPEPGLVARVLGRPWDLPPPPGAERVVSSATWEDLVLPPDRLEMVREFLLWIEHRVTVEEKWGGQPVGGPVALFAGPSGTGKTLAASVIANTLGWPLYRVDLGRLVSKYVGETEENLNRLFDAAHGHPMVLQFDEADALFGKRGEIKEARDRYANMEVSHLLSRIETHRGPCILTTNLRRQLDAAFTRRLQIVIEFPRPDTACRVRLWERLLPPRAPLSSAVIPAALADAVALSGGQIRNAALHAAYLAAGNGGTIDLPHLALGMWREITKEGHACVPSAIGSLAQHLPSGVQHG